MSASLPPPAPLASAHVVFFGQYGDVARLAAQRGTSRQSVYRQAHAVVKILDPQATPAPDEDLRQRLQDLQQRLEQTRQQLAHAVVLDAAKQAEFVATV